LISVLDLSKFGLGSSRSWCISKFYLIRNSLRLAIQSRTF